MPLGPRLERSVRATVLAARMLDLSASLPRRRCRFSCSCRFFFSVGTGRGGAGRGGGAARASVFWGAEGGGAEARARARDDRGDRGAVPRPGGTARGGRGRASALQRAQGGKTRGGGLGGGGGRFGARALAPARARSPSPTAQRTRRMMKGRPYSSNASDMVAAGGQARTQGSVSALSALSQSTEGRGGFCAGARAVRPCVVCVCAEGWY